MNYNKSNLFLLLFSLCFTVCLSSCSKDNEDIINNPSEEVILKFALIDPSNPAKRIECKIDHEKHEIIGQVVKGLDVNAYVMDYQLSAGVEALSPNRHSIPNDNKFVMRSEARNDDFIYTIKISEQNPFTYFKIYSDNDTISLSVDYDDHTLNAYFPEGTEASKFKFDFGLTEGITSDVKVGSNLTNIDQTLTIKQGEAYEGTYQLNLLEVAPSDLDPIVANVHSGASGFAFPAIDFTIDHDNQLVTAKVYIGGNPADFDGVADFETLANKMTLLFEEGASLDLLRNRTTLTKIDPTANIIEFRVEYNFRYTHRVWTYRYTFKNKIAYDAPRYAMNGGYQYAPEFAWLVVNGKRYLGKLPSKPNSTRTKHEIIFYQAKNALYNLNQAIATPHRVSGAFYSLIPFDADLENAHLEFGFAKNYPDLSLNQESFDNLPALNSITYRTKGVDIKFDNSSERLADSPNLNWKIYIATAE